MPLCLLEPPPPVSRITATTIATTTAARIRIPPRRELEGELEAGFPRGVLGGAAAPPLVAGGAGSATVAAAATAAGAAGGVSPLWGGWTLLDCGAGISGKESGAISDSALDTARAQLRAGSESLRYVRIFRRSAIPDWPSR